MGIVRTVIGRRGRAETSDFRPTADIPASDDQSAIMYIRALLASLSTALKAPQYIVAASSSDLDNERVATNTASIEWDFATAGQAKANAVAASETVAGISERATSAEVIAGTDTDRHVTPAGITAKIDTDGTLAGNLDTRIASQKAVKTFGDAIAAAAAAALSAHLLDTTSAHAAAAIDFTGTGGGTARGLQAYLQEHAVKITDYNTTCDGSTDNTAAVALAKATGKAIFVPWGQTVLCDAGSWTAGLVVFGEGTGSGWKWRNTSGSSSLFLFSPASAIDVTFRDITLDCNRQAHTDTSSYFAAIDFQAPSGSSLTLRRVNFINGRIIDVRVVGPTASGEFVDFDMEGCTFADGLVGSSTRAAQCVNLLDGVRSRLAFNRATLPTKPTTYGRAGFIHDGANRNGTDARGRSYIAIGNYFDNIGRGTADTLGCCDVYYGADNVVMIGNVGDQVCGRFLSIKGDQSRIVRVGNVCRDVFSSAANTAIAYALFQDLFDTSADKHLVDGPNVVGSSDHYGHFYDGGVARTATMTIATPAVVTVVGHGAAAGDVGFFSTTGALPTGVTAGTLYYVLATDLGADTFKFSATSGGAAVDTSGSQSGTHTWTRIGHYSNASITNPIAGACGVAAVHLRSMGGGVTIDNPVLDGGPVAIAFTAIIGALRINNGTLTNQTNDAVDGSASVAANTNCDFSINGTRIADVTDRAVTLSAVRSYDIDIDVRNAVNAIGTAGSTELSNIRGRFRGITGLWVKTGTDTAARFRDREVHSTLTSTLGFSTRSLTIASGAITAFGDWHFVDTEGAAATDDLDTINGAYSDGDMLTLFAASSSRDVVVKDGTNLKLAGDCTLNNAEDSITLIKRGGVWYEMCRSDNGA